MRAFHLALALAIAAPVHAQLATDQVPRQRTVPRAEEIRQAVEESRWHLGPIRVRPIFGLRDLGYENNVLGSSDDEATADWRGTLSLGGDLILPMGRKLYLTGTVNPEYTYYQKLTERRELGGRYGGSIVGLFNRLSVEAGGSTHKSIAPVSSELERSAKGRRNDVFARAEVDVFRRLSFFGSAQRQAQRFDLTDSERLQGLSLEQLERDETVFRGGVRYKIRSYVDVTAAVERGATEFVTAKETDNDTEAVIVGLHYDRPRFFVNLSAGTRKGEARGAFSTFPSFSTTTGSYYAQYQMGVPLAIDAYGHRAAVFSVSRDNPYFFETRAGVGFTLPVGQRLGFRVFGERGENDYPVVTAASGKRVDDVTVIGGGIAYRLYRKVVLSIVASESRYDSNIDTFDRSVLRIATLLSLRGDFFR